MIEIDKAALVEKLRNTGGHIGYSKSRRHPSTKPFLYTTKNSKDIINLEETAKQTQTAINFLAGILADKKQILFVGVKPEARMQTKNIGIALGMPHSAERFIGGTLTNFPEMKKRIDKLVETVAKREKGELSMYTKKEQSLISKDILRMTKNFGGLVGIHGTPAAIVVVDPRFEEIAVTEANYTRVPIVALANSDCNIKNIKYPIVVNEASAGSIAIILETITKSLENVNQ